MLDEAEFYEVAALMRDSYKKHRNEWEAARLVAFVTAQCNSRKTLKITDIVKFPWEKDEDKGGPTQGMTQEQFDATFAQMEEMLAAGII